MNLAAVARRKRNSVINMRATEQAVIEPAAAGKDKVEVTVVYTGQDPFVDEFPPPVPIGTVKRKAMKQFGIEESAADQYALQFDGVNLDDKVKVGDVAGEKVTLTLVRIKAQEKGYAQRIG